MNTEDIMLSLPDPIRSRIAPQSDGCWRWTGTIGGYGYGTYGGRNLHPAIRKDAAAHRVVWFFVHGWLPNIKDPGRPQLDHLCRVRHCVNPAHLEVVTMVENVRRGASAVYRTGRCKAGHDLEQVGLSGVQCAECRRLNNRAWYERMASIPCSVDGCMKGVKAVGMCSAHYERQRRSRVRERQCGKAA